MNAQDVALVYFDVSSLSTGWAVMDGSGKLTAYGTINPTGEMPSRLVQTKTEVKKLLQQYQPTFIGIEDMIAFRNGKITKMLNFFTGVVYAECYEYNGNEVYMVASTSVKKHMNINSRALKKQGYSSDGIKHLMADEVENRYGVKLDRSNKRFMDVADAIAGISKLHSIVKSFSIERIKP